MEPFKTTEDITPDALTHILRLGNHLNTSVKEVSIEDIGTGVGLMSQIYRLHLTYTGDESLANSLIIKLAADSENREIARLADAYTREVNFYEHVAGQLSLKVPKSYFQAVDQESYDCTVLVEDLKSGDFGEQITGPSAEQIRLAVSEIAGLHGQYWGEPVPKEGSWLFNVATEEQAAIARDALYLPSIEPSFENFSHIFNAEDQEIVREVGDRLGEFWHPAPEANKTLIHGDFRIDNVFFPRGSSSASIFDWQLFCRGDGMWDIAYLACQSIEPNLRQSMDQEIVTLYVERLKNLGVANYSFEEAWDDYRRNILCALFYCIMDTGAMELGNERGVQLAEATNSRNLRAIHDLNCTELL